MLGRRLAVVAASALALVSATMTTPALAANHGDRTTTTTDQAPRHKHATTTTSDTTPPRRTTTTTDDTTPRRTTTSTVEPSTTTASTAAVSGGPTSTTPTTAAPVAESTADAGPTSRYIVVVKSGSSAADVANEQKASRHFHVERVYRSALNGYVGDLTASDLDAVKADPRVDYVQPVHGVEKSAQILPWGVDLVSHSGNQFSSTHPGDGTGTVAGDVYIVDTGVQANNDINGGTDVNLKDSTGLTDCDGHGTHMAGIIGALDNTVGVVGVAPGVHIHGVKVLDCKGRGTDVNAISGLEWILQNGHAPAVVNMSFGGPLSDAFDQAVKNLVSAGYTVVTAAGNSRKDACNVSPAHLGSMDGVITVGATTKKDRPAGFSNWGKCVDMWAPGVKIPSLYLNGNLAVATGTSASAPHVAGTALLYMSTHSGTPAQIEAALKSAAVNTGHKSHGNPVLRVSAVSF